MSRDPRDGTVVSIPFKLRNMHDTGSYDLPNPTIDSERTNG